MLLRLEIWYFKIQGVVINKLQLLCRKEHMMKKGLSRFCMEGIFIDLSGVTFCEIVAELTQM